MNVVACGLSSRCGLCPTAKFIGAGSVPLNHNRPPYHEHNSRSGVGLRPSKPMLAHN